MKKVNWGNDKLIGSLAILKSTMVLEKDFISTYIPFVARVLIDLSGNDNVTIKDVIEGFGKEYGFSIERPAMTTILNKCAKRGLINKGRNAVYEVVLDKCTEVAIDKHCVNMKYEIYNEIIQHLQNYFKQQYNISLELRELETLLLSFLNEHSSKTIIANFDDIKDTEHSVQQYHYIISNFIKKCQLEDERTYQLIIDLAVAYLFTSAIAYGSDDEMTKAESYKNLEIYLDTPFVLRVLGLNGEEMKDATNAMLDQLYNMNCRFYVFSHTYDEINHILKDCCKWIDNPQYDACYASYALRTFVEKKFTKADVQEYIDTLDTKLKHYRIKIDDTNYYAGRFYNVKVDEEEIENNIISVYKENSPYFDMNSKKTTIDYDTKSISNILKLWSGKYSRTYKQAKYVLLTTNSTLAYITRKFDKKLNPNVENYIFPCITDVFLGTNMWLGEPISKMEQFSEKKLLADCMSLIEPNDALIRKLQDSIKRAFEDETITENQYYLLKSKAFSNDYIMQKTLGDEKYFTDSLTEELLEDIEKEIIHPYKNQIDFLNDSLNKEKAEKDKMQSQIQKMEDEDKEKKQKNMDKDAEYNKKAENIVTIISNVIISCVVIPVFSTIISCSGGCKIPSSITNISIILTLLLPSAGYILGKKGGKMHKIVKQKIANHYKVKDYKRTL